MANEAKAKAKRRFHMNFVIPRRARARSKAKKSKTSNTKKPKKKPKRKAVKKKVLSNEKKETRKKIANCHKKIQTLFLECKSHISTATSNAINLGKELNKLKKLVKKLGEKWEQYRKRRYPYIKGRKARRYMKLAKYIKLKKMPALTLIPMSVLEEMIDRTNKAKKSMEELFKNDIYKIDVSKVPKDQASIGDFENCIDDIMESLRTETGWWDVDDLEDLSKSGDRDLSKLQRKIHRYNKKEIRKKGKVESGELQTFMDRAVPKMTSNLRYILSSKNIIANHGKKSVIVFDFIGIVELKDTLVHFIDRLHPDVE